MNWKDRFRGIVEQEKEAAKNQKEREKQEKKESERVVRLYRDRIEKVCNKFTHAVGWKKKNPDWSDLSPKFWLGDTFSNYGETYGGHEIEVQLSSPGISICGCNRRRSGKRSRSISINEFTEDKLAQILVEMYKEINDH